MARENSALPLEITFEELAKMREPIVIDCRKTDEFESGHLKKAVNVPLQHITIRKEDLPCSASDEIVVYCRTGNRSFTFATYLRSIGYLKCQSIQGGYESFSDKVTQC
tara:strand:- start:218 stop:541 length:324 start_codon:yes stop_codon:yes gene_type:complete